MNSVLSLLNMYSLQVVPASGIPDGWMGLDIGPDSIKTFNESLDTTKTVIWNGPMGVFEFEKFAVGTEVRFHCFHCSYMRHFQFKDFFFFFF
jgi:3-phosphoglycerate kinase